MTGRGVSDAKRYDSLRIVAIEEITCRSPDNQDSQDHCDLTLGQLLSDPGSFASSTFTSDSVIAYPLHNQVYK